MTMTDPIADMLTRVRNANQAYHDTTTMPHSKIKVHIAEILVSEGYIASYAVEAPPPGAGGATVWGPRQYGPNAKATGLPKVLGGLGIAIISTSKGLLTDRQAHSNGVGGEVVAYVW